MYKQSFEIAGIVVFSYLLRMEFNYTNDETKYGKNNNAEAKNGMKNAKCKGKM